MREILIKWLREGLELQTGEELYIPCDNKVAQGDFYNSLRKELAVMRGLDSEEAAKLRISSAYKDRQFWVTIKKIALTPLTAFKKDNEGQVSRVTISNDKDKLRIQRLKEASYVKETNNVL
jgi:hypothetical protein